MNSESANKFIAALVKSLQTLCHGYVDFDDGIEIIGHLYLNIDSGSTFDYVVKEKVCKNAENATVFVSKSFHAEGKPENTLISDDKDVEDKLAANLEVQGMSLSGTTRLQSAITNISNVLSGAQSHHPSHLSSPQNTGKRKREHNGNYSQPPNKYTTLQSSSSSAMPYFSNNPTKHHSSNRDNSKHYNNPQSEFFGGDSNQSSGMGPDDEEDLDLDVTFVKEEYAERNAAHRNAIVARAHQDPSTSQGNMLQENNSGESGGSYPLGYHPNAPNQPFVGASGSDITGMSQPLQDPSQVDVGQHHVPPPPNPRSIITPTLAPPPTTSSGNTQTFQVPVAPTKYFRCNVCGIIIRHKNNIKRHMRRHNGDVFQCSYCQSTHTCKWQLQKHLEYKHGVFPGYEFMQSKDDNEEKELKFMTLSNEGDEDKDKVMQLLPQADDYDEDNEENQVQSDEFQENNSF